MNTHITGTMVAALILVSTAVAEAAPMRLAVDLLDGSRIIGVPENAAIRVRTDFAELVIPLTRIDLVTWKSDREIVTVRLHNGDILTGGIVPEPFKLKTLFGLATVSMEHVESFETVAADTRANTPLTDDLLLYFPFDDKPNGTKVVNAAQNKHHGKFAGAQWTSEGVRGGAFAFAQSTDRIEIPDDPALHVQQLTLCAWVLPLDDDKHGSYRGIITKTAPGNWSNGFGLACYPGKPDAHFFVNYYSAETVSKPVPDQQWSHLAASYDGQKMVLYLDGVRVDEKVPTSYGGPIRYGSESISIGAAPTGYHWIGKIDEVMLFGRVLSDHEVHRIYQRSLAR